MGFSIVLREVGDRLLSLGRPRSLTGTSAERGFLVRLHRRALSATGEHPSGSHGGYRKYE
jgi:hypothetical protein